MTPYWNLWALARSDFSFPVDQEGTRAGLLDEVDGVPLALDRQDWNFGTATGKGARAIS
jgi:hypothetical protein